MKSETKTESREGRTGSRATKKPKSGRRKENAILRYFRQTWAELKKVAWPDRQEATNLTLIVLIVTAAMTAFLGLVDFLFSKFFTLLIDISG